MTDTRNRMIEEHDNTITHEARGSRRSHPVRHRVFASVAVLGLSLSAGSAAFATGGGSGSGSVATGGSTVAADGSAAAKTPKLGDRDGSYYVANTQTTRAHSELTKKQVAGSIEQAIEGSTAECTKGLKVGGTSTCAVDGVDGQGDRYVLASLVKTPSTSHAIVMRQIDDWDQNPADLVGKQKGMYLPARVQIRDLARPSAVEDALEQGVIGTQTDDGDDFTADLKASCKPSGHDSDTVTCTLKGSDPKDGKGTWIGTPYQDINSGIIQYIFVKQAS